MKVVVNGLSARTGGGVTYLNRLLTHLGRMNAGVEYLVLVTTENRDKIVGTGLPGCQLAEVNVRNLGHRLLYEQLALPQRLKAWGADLCYAPAEITPFLSPCPVVLGIQNPNPYYSSPSSWSVYHRVRFLALRVLGWLSARKASKVIFVSETARRHISPRLGIDPAKTHAVHHGVDLDQFGPGRRPSGQPDRDGPDSSRDYILTVSDLLPHKNFPTLLRGYAALDPALRREYRLLIVGHGPSSQRIALAGLSESLGIRADVTFAGEMAHHDLPSVFAGAAAFVLPSYLETFGITLVEAMVSGVPVVAADASAIPEVLGGAGLLFDPHDPAALAACLTRVLTDRGCREELVAKGSARAASFSWKATAEATLAIFKAATSASRPRGDIA